MSYIPSYASNSKEYERLFRYSDDSRFKYRNTRDFKKFFNKKKEKSSSFPHTFPHLLKSMWKRWKRLRKYFIGR